MGSTPTLATKLKRPLVVLLLTIFLLAVVVYNTFFIVRVQGFSMFPTYASGDRVLAIRIFSLTTGDVVVAEDPENEIVIKRILFVDEQKVYLVGDNAAESIDSRSYGPIQRDRVIGKVIGNRH